MQENERRQAATANDINVCDVEFFTCTDIIRTAIGRGDLHCSDPCPWTQRYEIVTHNTKWRKIKTVVIFFDFFSAKGEPGEKGQKGAPGRPGRVGPPGEIGIVFALAKGRWLQKSWFMSHVYSPIPLCWNQKKTRVKITLLGLIMCCYITNRPSRDG